MSTYRLDRLLAPRSVAIVGGSPREKSIGRMVLGNLRAGGFKNAIAVVNPFHTEIDGVRTVARLQDLAQPPDVVIVAVPPALVLETIDAAGECGASVAIVLTAGLGHGPGSIAEAVRLNARGHGLRVVGPNCLGVIAPGAHFNGSFSARMPLTGDLALISQSGAVAAAMVEWAAERGIGFSAVASVGDQIDVDVGDLLDQFALDGATRAILLYVESIKDARKFMSAARAAARVKPVIVVKAGRRPAGARAAATHTGALAGADAVYDAAFRRAGLLRVDTMSELFAAAETVGRIRTLDGKRLAILTNGGGVGVLAVDRLTELGGVLAELSPETRARLDRSLPATWSQANPVDIIGDADAARYCGALDALLQDDANDAILVMNVPTAVAAPADVATAIARTVRAHREDSARPKPVLAVWFGSEAAARAFRSAGIPCYATEADAVAGFMHLVRYRDAAQALMDVPPSLPPQFKPDAAAARRIVAGAVAEGRGWLDPIECAEVLRAYAIATIPTLTATDPDQAATAAAAFIAKGGAVALKIHSRDIVHKSDVGGVRLNLTTEAAVREAAADIMTRARQARPDARILGVTVQPMIVQPQARELIAGIADDPTFGPVIVFGHGGTGVEVIDDKALALPPLDLAMAHDLIARTRVSRLLRGYRNVPAANEPEVALTLVKLAQLAADIPEIRALDINPLLADEQGVTALDARIAVAKSEPVSGRPGHPRFATRPYPTEWERSITLADGLRVLVRPIRPQDESLLPPFFARTTQEDLRMRFFAPMKDFSHAFMARLTQLDYARAMAFVALDAGNGELLGVVRLHADADYTKAEYAILLRSDLKGRGLGWKLMSLIIDYARSEGLKQIHGQVLRENTTMLRMCSEQGFVITDEPGEGYIKRVTLTLA